MIQYEKFCKVVLRTNTQPISRTELISRGISSNSRCLVVVFQSPDGQISNNYHLDDWDLFDIPEVECAKYEFDGHTGHDVIKRL